MTKLEKLIQELCPNGVEYKKLGEILQYKQPTNYIVASTDYSDNYKTPVLTAGQTFILGYTNEENNIFLASKECPVIIFDDFTTAFKWVDFNFKVKSSAMKILLNISNDKSILKYVYYAMQLIQYNSFEHGRKWISIYSNIEIPFPPLEIQKEIVSILDNFTELENELDTRKKQYEFYRKQLLTFENNNLINTLNRQTKVQWIPLGETAIIGTGSSNSNEEDENGIYPFYVRSQDIKRKNSYEFDEIAIITAGDGVGVGKVFHYVEGKYALHQRAYRIVITSNKLLPKFFYYYMKNNFLLYITNSSFHSSVTSIRKPMLENYLIPLPPFKEQKRIVSILDKFETLCNDLNSGLPAEIEARKKQYEYYRDKLLTFKNIAEG